MSTPTQPHQTQGKRQDRRQNNGKLAVLRWRPFPVDVLPEPVRGYVVAVSEAMRVDSCIPALGVLATVAACVGTTRQIQLKRRWHEYPTLWAIVVAEQGSGKSPPTREALRPLYERQRKTLAVYAEDLAQHKHDKAAFERDMMTWKKLRNSSEPPPEEPSVPVAVRHIVSDCTLEGLAPILQENPRGVLLDGDELGGWLGAFDRYTGGKGGVDAAAWRKVFDSHAITVDRKTGRQIIHVENPFVSIIGTIQPDALQRSLGVEHLESGMAARLLLTFPPAQPLMWSDADIPLNVERQYEVLLERLLALEYVVNGDGGQPHPITLELDKPSRRRFVSWHNKHRTEQAEMKGVLAGHWSKLVAYCARFALLGHLIRQATDETTSEVIDLVSMDAAIELAEWFGHEAKRVYAMMEESDEGRDRRRLVEWIGRKGGSVTAREVQQGNRQFRTADDAETALSELVKARLGKWETLSSSAKGGRPTRVFRLSVPSTVYETPAKPEEGEGFVDVDTVDGPENTDSVNDLLAKAAVEDLEDRGDI